MGLYRSTGLVSGASIVRPIVEGQGPKASLGFNPPEASAGQSAGTPALMKLAQVSLRIRFGVSSMGSNTGWNAMGSNLGGGSEKTGSANYSLLWLIKGLRTANGFAWTNCPI